MPNTSSDAGRRAAEALQILTEASDVVARHPLDLDDLLRALAELIRKVVDYQLIAVMLADDDESLTIRYSIGYRPDLVRRLRVRPGEGITGAAAQTRRAVVVDDVRNDPRYLPAVDAVRSEIAVPLIARDKLVGLIDLQSPRLSAFGEYERQILELIASRFSLAIDAALLYRATIEQNATLRTLTEIAQGFSHILELDKLLNRVSELVRELIRYDAFNIYLLEDDNRLKHYFGVRFDKRVQWQTMALGEGLVGHAARDREAILCRDTAQDPRYVVAVEGIRSEVAVPLILRDELIGVVDLESERLGAFTEAHMQALTLLAPQVAAAIENARLYEQVRRSQARMQADLTAARQLQQHLLPTDAPAFEGIEVAARNLPAREVSGDLYDFHAFPGECFGIFNGDVSGKGAAAALYAALASGLIRNLAPLHHQPQKLLSELNRDLLSHRIEGRYLVAVYAHWRPAQRELLVASAGQPRPILRRNGKAEALEIGGTPLGLFDLGNYDEVRLQLRSGDVLVTASDGLAETVDAKGNAYGDSRLLEVIEQRPNDSAAELLQAILDDAREFSGRDTPEDDRTVVVLRVL